MPYDLERIAVSTPYDAALLKLKNTSLRPLPIPTGNPSDMAGGETIYVMGYPGTEEWFQNQGTLTNLGGVDGSWSISAAMDRGISGGPIFNQDAQVVAIVWGGIPKAVDDSKRVIPINHLAPIWIAAGVSPNFGTRRRLRHLDPGEQLALRLLEGIDLVEGRDPMIVFHNGVSSLTAAKDNGLISFVVQVPEDVYPTIRITSTNFNHVRQYALSRDNKSCIGNAERDWANTTCGSLSTAAELTVESVNAGSQKVKRLIWRIPANELDYGDQSVRVALQNGHQDIGRFKFNWVR